MAAFNFMSHGTQDYFPTFLEDDFGAGHTTITIVAIIYNVGALIGGMYVGALSQRFGAARTIIRARPAAAARRCRCSRYAPDARPRHRGRLPDADLRAGRVGRHPRTLTELSPDEYPGFLPRRVPTSSGKLLAVVVTCRLQTSSRPIRTLLALRFALAGLESSSSTGRPGAGGGPSCSRSLGSGRPTAPASGCAGAREQEREPFTDPTASRARARPAPERLRGSPADAGPRPRSRRARSRPARTGARAARHRPERARPGEGVQAPAARPRRRGDEAAQHALGLLRRVSGLLGARWSGTIV